MMKHRMITAWNMGTAIVLYPIILFHSAANLRRVARLQVSDGKPRTTENTKHTEGN